MFMFTCMTQLGHTVHTVDDSSSKFLIILRDGVKHQCGLGQGTLKGAFVRIVVQIFCDYFLHHFSPQSTSPCHKAPSMIIQWNITPQEATEPGLIGVPWLLFLWQAVPEHVSMLAFSRNALSERITASRQPTEKSKPLSILPPSHIRINGITPARYSLPYYNQAFF